MTAETDSPGLDQRLIADLDSDSCLFEILRRDMVVNLSHRPL